MANPESKINRAGRYVSQPSGYKAFIPNPLPPTPALVIDDAMLVALSSADRAIGRLDSVADQLPTPDFFVRMYMRREAVYSSQIEGTQASLSDLLEFEAGSLKGGESDVLEPANYVKAMNLGLERLETLELSLRLIKEIHLILLKGVRGQEFQPGEFRSSQNWIGPGGSPLSDALFVPPPPHETINALGDLEKFIHDELDIPPLIKAGLVHAQFETIHPFLDGNGRIGRLLITFMLCWRGVLKKPLLYLSHYFRKHQNEYYNRLQAVRDEGDWEGWMKFFLEGVGSVASQATEKAHQIINLREEHRAVINETTSSEATVLLDELFTMPFVRVNGAAKILQRSLPTAGKIIAALEKAGILEEITGAKKHRLYVYQPYLELLEARIPKKQ